MPALDMPQFSPRRSLINCAVALMALTISLLISTFGAPLSQAWALATEHRPEAYTELYFNTSTHNPLPSSAPVGKVRTFSFHIANHEQKSWHYVYHVTMQINGRMEPIRTGSVDLAAGQGTDIPIPFTITVPAARAVIDVALDQPSQHISFRSES